MSEKQTRCPNCSTIYKVTVTQLTVAQGMVCCPKCSAEFNALLNLNQVKDDQIQQPPLGRIFDQTPMVMQDYSAEQHVLDIFQRKPESSNINLRTYLNNLNTFNNDPVTQFPALNLASGQHHTDGKFSKKTVLYYGTWSLVNLTLVFLLIFQVLWFNPQLLERHPLLNAAFIQTCHAFNCETLDERYTHIKPEQITLARKGSDQTEFKGVLVNHYKKGLELPLIKVSLMKQNKVIHSMIKSPSEYLIESLHGITRIPTESPFKFHFFINTPRNSFDSYKIEVIRP
ncbi:DUF3426 domain-containing protein [Acinetobacter sp. 187]|uniref:zinc-ribbon and DUF3426 domain-containing protein n=1 Tax=Acinetobacter lanii TaxID=2715163 RepID=UPI00140E868C|nr:zinc-ribbon and DUF3426 domain-containing protein [Acinetobacter lanii]NHC02220.1 DUF3426 domain-containing protein [Acinetobacter lanii]